MSSYHGRFLLGVDHDEACDGSSSRNQNKKNAGCIKSESDPGDYETLIDEATTSVNIAESQAITVGTPIYRKSEDTLCHSKKTDQRPEGQLTPQCTPMSTDNHTNQIVGRIKSSGMKGKARRVARKRQEETNARTPLQSSINSLYKTTHPITPSPRGASTFSFTSKAPTTTKIREMKKIRNVRSSWEHCPNAVDASPSASISTRLSSLSLMDEKRKCLSSGARRVPLGSLPKSVNNSQVEELSMRTNDYQLKYTLSHHPNKLHADEKKLKEKPPDSATITSLKDDFLYERLLDSDEGCKKGNEELLAVHEAKVEAIRLKLKNEKEFKINDDLLTGCISYEENLCNLLHSSIDSDVLIESPQTNKQSSGGKHSIKSKVNQSFDSLSEHFRVINDDKKMMNKLRQRDGSVNPMSKTLSRDDAELLFRTKALSQRFSFSGAASAFSGKRMETSSKDMGKRGNKKN